MNREQHEYELASSHARGESEDRHNKRLAEMREIDRQMKERVKPIYQQPRRK